MGTTAGAARRSTGRLRLVDLAIVCATAPIWAPALAVLSAVVLVTSGRPVLFRQERIGRHGRPFVMHKFRTMRTGPNPLVPDPDRITPIGRWLRRTSLDELPQLVDVLRGDMSLVGPRPMLPTQADRLDRRQSARHDTRPGMTGMAQTRGRNRLDWSERIELDLRWTTTASVSVYLDELRRTPSAVLDLRGVTGHSTADRFVREGTE